MTNAAGDRVLWFRGHKVVNIRTLRRDPWLALTRIPFVVYDVDPDESNEQALDLCAPAGLSKKERALDVLGAVETWDSTRNAEGFLAEDSHRQAHIVGAGVVRSTVGDAIRLSLSMRVTHDRNVLQRLRWRWRYNKFFFSTVIPLRVWALRRTRRINPYDPQENFRIDKTTLADPIHDNEDRPRFSVTRYRGAAPRDATRGPAAGARIRHVTLAFHAASADSLRNTCRLGYDVWLFDYRASDKLDVSLEQFDIDVLATQDFPEAIETVYQEVNRPRIELDLEPLSPRRRPLSGVDDDANGPAGRRDQDRARPFDAAFPVLCVHRPPWQTRLKVRLHLPGL
jgi:hypothetical protein